jgi:hypothetical protein
MLANSTILDNGAIINLVNNKTKLELGLFIKVSSLSTIVEYGTQRLPIVGHGTRVLKGVFN